jgi:hypothetical protein
VVELWHPSRERQDLCSHFQRQFEKVAVAEIGKMETALKRPASLTQIDHSLRRMLLGTEAGSCW